MERRSKTSAVIECGARRAARPATRHPGTPCAAYPPGITQWQAVARVAAWHRVCPTYQGVTYIAAKYRRDGLAGYILQWASLFITNIELTQL